MGPLAKKLEEFETQTFILMKNAYFQVRKTGFMTQFCPKEIDFNKK